MRIALVLAVLVVGCGTSASVGGPGGAAGGSAPGQDGSVTDSGLLISDAPAAGTIRERSLTVRSASVRLEGDRRVLTLRDYASDCGVVQGGLPSQDSASVHVVLRRDSPGEEIIELGDNHSATFQIGIDPKTVQAFPARGRVRLDTFSTTVGDIVKGAVSLESSVGRVSGTFEAGVCVSP